MLLQEGEKVPTGLKGILVTPEDVEADSDGKKVALSSLFKEKPLVLYFYPKDNTPGCTTQACNIRDNYGDLMKAGVNIIGCSRDDVKSHKKFMAKQGLPFPLLSDDSQAITEAFGAWGEKKMYGKVRQGIIRSTFIIKKGKVVKVFPKVKVKEHTQEILAALAEL